jgi:hypothetical protein
VRRLAGPGAARARPAQARVAGALEEVAQVGPMSVPTGFFLADAAGFLSQRAVRVVGAYNVRDRGCKIYSSARNSYLVRVRLWLSGSV